MRNIAIIGGGASGIAAAITAAEAGARVTVFEAGKRIGRSILTSGNGRCNWSNTLVKAEGYANAPFVARAFETCPPGKVHDWFSGLGLHYAMEPDGRLYPKANKASSVLDVLRFRLDELGVRVECERPAARVQREGGAWDVMFADGATRRFDAVAVAVGGGIARDLLPEGYAFAKRRPRLCPIRTDRASVKGLDNIRVKCEATLLHSGEAVARERGEVQFRPYGISGIAIFNLSRFAVPGDVVTLDLLDFPEKAVAGDLQRRLALHSGRSGEDLLAGMVLPQVARAVLRQAGFDAACAYPPGGILPIARRLKAYELRVEGFEEGQAQVRQGGVALNQVNPATMESLRDAGLYVLGEALDVDGPCGGYNLHWAWTCGLLAGSAAAGRPLAPGDAVKK